MPRPFEPEDVAKIRDEIEQASPTDHRAASPEEHQEAIQRAHAEALSKSQEGKQLSHVPKSEVVMSDAFGYSPDPPSKTPKQEGEAVVYPFTGKLGKILKDCAVTGEPVFVFRAKDIFSTMVLTRYLEIVESYGPSDHEFQRTIVESIQMFKDWQAANTDKVRYPD
jgi:hypothetical protein